MSHAVRLTAAVGIVLPVRNEERLLSRALDALAIAGANVDVPCVTAVVLDCCSDKSSSIARRWQRSLRRRGANHRAIVAHSGRGNVGAARRLGADALLERWRPIADRFWLATTDADTTVPAHWLSEQVQRHEAGVDVWTSRVTVEGWEGWRAGTAAEWQARYDVERGPIHGASLGMNGATYLRAGGFCELAHGEDRALYEAAVLAGGVAFHDRSVHVVTSGRRKARAPLGFSSALASIERTVAVGPPPTAEMA